MANFAILRTEKLKTVQDLAGAGAHVYRLRDTPNADPNIQNYRLIPGDTNLLHKMVNSRIEEVNPPRVRKNSVRAIEFVLTASSDFFEDNPKSLNKWAKENVKWLQKKYGKENVVSAVLHLDEQTPHIHAHVVPITKDGRLSAKDIIGGTRDVLRDLQSEYADAMKGFGLERGKENSKATHQEISDYMRVVKMAKLKFKPVKVGEPPVFGRGKYKESIEKKLNNANKKATFWQFEANRLGETSSSTAYSKLEKEKKEEQEEKENLRKNNILLKQAVENAELEKSRIQEDYEEYSREMAMKIENLIEQNQSLTMENSNFKKENRSLKNKLGKENNGYDNLSPS